MSSSAPEAQIHSQDNLAAPAASLPTATCSVQPEQLVSGEWAPLFSGAVMTRMTKEWGTRPRLCPPPALCPSIQLRSLVHPANISDPEALCPHSHMGSAKPPRGMSQSLGLQKHDPGPQRPQENPRLGSRHSKLPVTGPTGLSTIPVLL